MGKKSQSNTPISEYWETVGDAFFKASKVISTIVKHNVTIGSAREILVRNFLRKFVPKRFGIVTGFVIGQDGTPSSQQDVIVYDSHNFSPLYCEGELAVVPADAVVYCIEVKSTLDKKRLFEAINNSLSVRRIAPRCYQSIFAFESRLTLKRIAENCCEFLKSAHNLSDELYISKTCPAINTITVLNRGSILWWSSKYQANRSACDGEFTFEVPRKRRNEKFVLGAQLAMWAGALESYNQNPQNPIIQADNTREIKLPGSAVELLAEPRKGIGFYCPRWHVTEFDALHFNVYFNAWGWSSTTKIKGDTIHWTSPFNGEALDKFIIPKGMSKKKFCDLFDRETRFRLRKIHNVS